MLNSDAEPVAGAYNRRYVIEQLSKELESSRLFDQPVALLICSLDGLPQIDETLGSGTGAEIVRGFVGGVLGSIRGQSDWMARIDVDQFLLVLPQTGLSGGRHVAERLQRLLKDQPPLSFKGPTELTMSIGVTALENSYELMSVPILEFLRTVDHCLHTSRRLGCGHVTAQTALQARALSADIQSRPKHDFN